MAFLILISLMAAFSEGLAVQYSAIIIFYPFFMAGFLFPKDILNKILSLAFSKKVLLFCAIALIGLTLYFVFNSIFSFEINDFLPNVIKGVRYRSLYVRGIFLLLSALCALSFLIIFQNKPLPFLTKIGRNSLSILIFYCPTAFFFQNLIKGFELSTWFEFTSFMILSAVICAVLGSDFISSILNKCLDFSSKALCRYGLWFNILRAGVFIIIAFIMCMPMIKRQERLTPILKSNSLQHEIMAKEREKEFDSAYKIIFAGDLILLEDQVKRALNGDTYDFKNNFEYTKKYIKEADLAIGVLEGPLGEGVKKFSRSNFGDNKTLYVNMPDSYADAIKDAGFNLLTTANNHCLDAGVEGSARTIDVLNKKHIDFTGSYKTKEEKQNNRVKLIEKNGLKFAVLSYTYGVNGYSTKELYDGDLSYVTNIIPAPFELTFRKAKKSVENDFKIAKSYNPDFIIVLPHWGPSFTEKTDFFQAIWEHIFIKNGADIILGDHSHHVQPVKIKHAGNKNVYVLYSPGNYANVYQKDNGDISALGEIYIDKKTKKIIGGSIIPMWTQSPINGNFRAIPLYDIYKNAYKINDSDFKLSTYDFDRVKEAHRLTTKYMLGQEMEIDMAQERYYFDAKGFLRKKAKPLVIDEKIKQGKMYQLLKNSKNVCFIGDSITKGSNNNGAPWYEPIENLISGNVINISFGGATTKTLLLKRSDEIASANADLYVIAIGVNDIRYRKAKICAMDEKEYIGNLEKLKRIILNKNPNAKFVFIAPWVSADGDIISKPNYDQKTALGKKYSNALKVWCKKENDLYIDPNKYISDNLDKYIQKKYLVDFIHPNMNEGIKLYSEAVLRN